MPRDGNGEERGLRQSTLNLSKVFEHLILFPGRTFYRTKALWIMVCEILV